MTERAGPDPSADGPILDYPTEPLPAARSGGRSPAWALVAVPVVVLVLVVAVLARRPGSGSAGPVPGPARPDHVVDLPVGSPTDGLGTKMLPVRVMPDKGLVDGQLVVVSGWGFPPNVFVGGVMCTGAAKTQGVAACDLTNIGYNATTDAEGTFQLTFPVRRYPLIANQRVDCMTGNVDPDDFAALIAREGPHPTTANPSSRTCIIAVGEVANYDNSGGWPIAFDGETFLHGDATTTTTGPATSTPTGTDPTPDPSTTAAPAPSVTGPSTETSVPTATGPGPTTGPWATVTSTSRPTTTARSTPPAGPSSSTTSTPPGAG